METKQRTQSTMTMKVHFFHFITQKGSRKPSWASAERLDEASMTTRGGLGYLNRYADKIDILIYDHEKKKKNN